MKRRRKVPVWRKVVGGYGHTVTLTEREPGGVLYLRWFDAGARGGQGGPRWKSLGHRDRTRGERQAAELAGQFLANARTAFTGVLTVGALFARYQAEVNRHKRPGQERDDARRMDMWQAFIGIDRDVKTIDRPTLDRFVRARRTGKIQLPDHPEYGAVSDTTIGHDIRLLKGILNWATDVVQADGSPLLERNPVRGYRCPTNANPARPVASYERYLAIRAQADTADPIQKLFGPFLDLVEATGWRVSALCQLRASDVDRKAAKDAPFGRILKREETDKANVHMWVPLSRDARTAIDRLLEINSVVGAGWLFPAPLAQGKPWSYSHAIHVLRRAEAAAELEPLKWGAFHPFRRKWATERKHLPIKDVAEAGGWRNTQTLLRHYQQTDPATLLAVVSEPTKLRESV